MKVAGIDGTAGGWVAIILENGRFAADHLLAAIETDFHEVGDASIVAIDVPIGFGPRQADIAARAFLTGAASTVFTTPTQDILRAPFGPGLVLPVRLDEHVATLQMNALASVNASTTLSA